MKIDCLVGDNPYGTTTYFAKGLAAALKQQHVDVRLSWIGEGHFFHAFYEMLDDPPDLTCSFSDISIQGRSLSHFWTIPHLSLLVDPPIYFLHQLCGENNWISCVDQYDCSFVNSLGFQNHFFFPHAADQGHLTAVDRERPYDVAFFGTCIDYEKIAQKWPQEDRELLQYASDKVLSHSGLSIAQVLIEMGVQSCDLPRLHGEVDQYTRGKDRIELIRSLKGHQIHIWGEGAWDKYLTGCSVYPALSFNEIIEKMKLSKIVLNSAPRFKAGTHERIFYAFICGAAVYTGETPFLSNLLPELFTYRFGEWENPQFSQWQERAFQGQHNTLLHHTWDARATTLIEKMKKNR